MQLKVLDEKLKVLKLDPLDDLPEAVLNGSFYSIAKTDEELSIVIDEAADISSSDVELGWRAIKIVGPLDFSLVGILSKISTALADAGISIFALSTYDTDYVLVKGDRLEGAINALSESGHELV